MNRTTRLALGLLVAAVYMPAALGQQYQVTDLGTLGGSISQANSNNVFSQVAGFSTLVGDTATHAFLWTKRNGMKDLGTLPILACLTPSGNSSASAINDAGIVVGVSDFCDPVNGLVSHAFVDIRGQMKDLGTLGGSTAQANGINVWGQVVGFSFVPDNSAQHAVLWNRRGIQDLGTLGGTNSQAFGNNIWGQVVGSSDTASGSSDPFLWDSKHGMKDLGTLGGMSAQANAINFFGEIVGFSSLLGETATHAFIYSNGKLTDIGTLGGSFAAATGIDLYGDVVGFSNTTGDADVHAFIYTRKGGLQDLNNLIPTNNSCGTGTGWCLNSAQSISLGEGDDFEPKPARIVGVGVLNGEQHAFLLTPTH
jgi:probable HAF family extracellular repeat protein